MALDQLARFLLAADTVDRADLPAAWFAPDAGAQRAARHACRGRQERRLPLRPALEGAGDATARRRPDRLVEGEPVVAPYDDCVLIMPSTANLRPA